LIAKLKKDNPDEDPRVIRILALQKQKEKDEVKRKNLL
jgi:hypothetical protein